MTEYTLGETVRIDDSEQLGEVYRKPPFSEATKVSDSEGENGEIQVMRLHDDGTYDHVVTVHPDYLTKVE